MRRIVNRLVSKYVYWMLVAVVTLVFCLEWGQVDISPAQAQGPNAFGGQSSGLITHFQQLEGGATRVVVIDSNLKRLAVYKIDLSGASQLQSVRNLTLDLQVQEYNSSDPSPLDMQKLLERNN